MDIIPAIDIIDGRCVRLRKGNFSEQTVYSDDPVEVALLFRDHGVRRLHVVDLDGARAGKVVNYRLLEKIFKKSRLVIDFGGGIKTDMDVEIAFQSGAAMIIAGSMAVKDPERISGWIHQYGPDKIILGADVNKGKIYTNAWQTETDHDLFTFIRDYSVTGINKVICTDISRDGMLKGPAIRLYKQLRSMFSDICLIASGGISVKSDLDKLIRVGMDGAIIGKAIYEQTITLKELQNYIG